MSKNSYQLDKCLAQCDYLIQSFKDNPKSFIYGLLSRSKGKGKKQTNSDTGKNGDYPGEKSCDEEESDSDDLDAFSDLKRKMIQTYLELKEEEEKDEDVCRYGLRLEGRLMEKLVKNLGLSYLILNLYSNNEGYSIGMKKCRKNGLTNNHSDANNTSPSINSATNGNTDEGSDDQEDEEVIETIKLPYEEEDLLDFIDNEELPPMLVDIFDNFAASSGNDYYQIFYCGSIFIEIRDYRKNASNKVPYYESNFVRLKPTNQTLLNDVTRLTSSFGHLKNWTQEEKTALEAKLILETAEPLCLDPSPVVAIISNRLDYGRKWIKASKNVERLMKKNSQVFLNRVKKFQTMPAPKGLELHDFLKSREDRTPIAIRLNKKINSTANRRYSVDPIDPKLIEIEKFAKKLDPIVFKNDNSLAKSDEYIMEFLNTEGRASMTCVTIYHKSLDDSYFGQLYLDKRKDILNKSGNSCLFRLGHKSMVEKYIDQFKEILTENGRKPVKITHKVPNQPPKVTHTVSASPFNGSTPTETEELDERESLTKKPKILQTNSKNAISVLPNLPHRRQSSILSSSSSQPSASPSPTSTIPSTSSSTSIPMNAFIPLASSNQVNSICIVNPVMFLRSRYIDQFKRNFD